jgi:ketosteroid isomerase-like protein
MLIPLYGCVGTGFNSAPSPEEDNNQTQISKDKRIDMKPEDVHTLFHKYFKEQDLEGLGSLFDENAMFIPGKDLDPVFGRENIKQALKKYLDSPASIENLSKSIHQNGDIAMVKSAWRIKTEDGYIEGVALEVMKRLPDGRWVYIIDNPYGI